MTSAAWGDWLRRGLEEDYGRPVDGDRCTAVDAVAKRLLREDLMRGLSARDRASPPSGATATTGWRAPAGPGRPAAACRPIDSGVSSRYDG